MAGLDNQIIENASDKAQELEQRTNWNRLKHQFVKLYNQISNLLDKKDSVNEKEKLIQSFIESIQDVLI